MVKKPKIAYLPTQIDQTAPKNGVSEGFSLKLPKSKIVSMIILVPWSNYFFEI